MFGSVHDEYLSTESSRLVSQRSKSPSSWKEVDDIEVPRDWNMVPHGAKTHVKK